MRSPTRVCRKGGATSTTAAVAAGRGQHPMHGAHLDDVIGVEPARSQERSGGGCEHTGEHGIAGRPAPLPQASGIWTPVCSLARRFCRPQETVCSHGWPPHARQRPDSLGSHLDSCPSPLHRPKRSRLASRRIFSALGRGLVPRTHCQKARSSPPPAASREPFAI